MLTWPWLALVGLGAFHGLNPAMGWLFAVALGLNRASRTVVLLSLIPIAAGHALAVALVALAMLAFGLTADQHVMRLAAGGLLIAWAVYHFLYGARHRARVGMRAGMVGLTLWSFLMASAHGAGLMLVPILFPLTGVGSHAGHTTAADSLTLALLAVGVHTFAMLAVTGIVAVVVYEWVGVAFLRRGWVNLDPIWTASLVVTGLLLLITAGAPMH
jgi:hypothetical protein